MRFWMLFLVGSLFGCAATASNEVPSDRDAAPLPAFCPCAYVALPDCAGDAGWFCPICSTPDGIGSPQDLPGCSKHPNAFGIAWCCP